MPSISDVRTQEAPPLQIQFGQFKDFRVFATINDTIAVNNVSITSNSPVLLQLIYTPVDPAITNVGDYEFVMRAVSTDFTIGSNPITMRIDATNTNGESTFTEINYEIIITPLPSNFGLGLPGQLNVVQVNLNPTGDSLVQPVNFAIADAPRPSADGNQSFTHFIEATTDLNSLISYSPSQTDDTDDAYGFAGITVLSSNASNELRNLPTNNNVIINAGEIDTKDITGDSLGSYSVNLTMSIDQSGRLSSEIAITGSTITTSIADDAHKAQKVFWNPIESRPSVAANDADILVASVTSRQLTEYYLSTLNTINNLYNGVNVIQSWSITFQPLPASSTNLISQHARFLGKVGDVPIFDETTNNKIVTSNSYVYNISINDYLSNATPIISSTNIKGVLRHVAS